TDAETQPTVKNSDDDQKTDAAKVKENLRDLKLEPISGKTPYYVDKGVTMIPIRPICEFFGLDISYRSGLISISGRLPQATTENDPTEKRDEEEANSAENDL